MRYNLLISATRQWNPGDEFIMQGCQNVLTEMYGEIFNPIIFNRNPDIRRGARIRNIAMSSRWTMAWDRKAFKGKGILGAFLNIGHYDNSFKDDMPPELFDLAVFAGSPEWYSRRLAPMYECIQHGNIPSLFLGLGAGDTMDFSKMATVVLPVLRQSKLITVRDESTKELLEGYGINATYLPCPAFLAAQEQRVVSRVKRIGLIYATNQTVKGNCVSAELHDFILRLYPKIAKKYSVGLVCHYVDEIEQARREFPEIDLHYSYDSLDYRKIYNEFDLVIGGRVHGIGLAASLGIPGIMLMHDERSSTARGFKAECISYQQSSIEEVLQCILVCCQQIAERSQGLVFHKEKTKKQYMNLIEQACKTVFVGGGYHSCKLIHAIIELHLRLFLCFVTYHGRRKIK